MTSNSNRRGQQQQNRKPDLKPKWPCGSCIKEHASQSLLNASRTLPHAHRQRQSLLPRGAADADPPGLQNRSTAGGKTGATERSETARKFFPYDRPHSRRTELPFRMCKSRLPLFSTTLRNALPSTSSTKWAAPTTFSSSPSSLSEAASLESLELLLLLLGEPGGAGLSTSCQLLLPGNAELSELAVPGLCWSQRPDRVLSGRNWPERTATRTRSSSRSGPLSTSRP